MRRLALIAAAAVTAAALAAALAAVTPALALTPPASGDALAQIAIHFSNDGGITWTSYQQLWP